jgi:predicted AAA+ superfamily ATPase
MEIGKKNGIIFVDEIQRKENAGLFLKGIYDKKFSYKWILSGSGSLELKDREFFPLK